MIKILEKNVADKIAAGEVIERPVSIIKELIENSIDAGSTDITVEIRRGGKEYIRVTDNGSGIAPSDAQTAFLRHATSKISAVSDLSTLTTLGFRGEALASIAAVTRTEMVTRTADEGAGSRIVIHGGEIVSSSLTGAPLGTTMIVSDLFYNTPARAKFLKSEAAESGIIIDLVSRIALTRTDIRFRLISNGNSIFATNGSSDLKSAVISVYKEREYKDLVHFDRKEGKVRIYGLISKPSLTRANKRSQYFYVNGRVVKSNIIEKGLYSGYKERIFEGRHPVAFIFIETDPRDLDVNIHPNKKEVRFNNETEIIACVSEVVRETLQEKQAVSDIDQAVKFAEKQSEYHKTNQIDHEPEEKHTQVDIKTFLSTKREEQAKIPEIEHPDIVSEREVVSEEPEIKIKSPSHIPFDFDEITVGQILFGTYITAWDDDSFYLIDQHAAHERVNYEKFVNAYMASDKASQLLLMPFSFDVPLEMTQDDSEWTCLLEKMGFAVEKFGENTYLVREIPQFIEISEAEEFLKVFTDNFYENTRLNLKPVIDKLITKACKSSIKAHDMISHEEALSLMTQLKNCINPFSCPHGRPTVVRFSITDIEKLFNRIV